MKKCFVILWVVMIVFILAACGGGSSGKQTINFQGITMDIPSNWKVEESTLSDDYAIYENKDSKGHAYKLLLMDTFGLLDGGDYDLQAAGEFFKEVTEDDASYSDPSDPVAGKFAGKYDMHTIDCTYNVINISKGGEAAYPCRLIRIYMGDHDVMIRFSAADGDFEAFDTAIAEAVCQ